MGREIGRDDLSEVVVALLLGLGRGGRRGAADCFHTVGVVGPKSLPMGESLEAEEMPASVFAGSGRVSHFGKLYLTPKRSVAEAIRPSRKGGGCIVIPL